MGRRILASLLLFCIGACDSATPELSTIRAAQIHAVPADFYWGVAGSGHQVEGYAPDSNWRRYDEQKTFSVKQPYLNAVDYRHRYAEDIALAKNLGINIFRFGMQWALIEPAKGVIDPSALAYYDDVLRQVRAAGMTPMITLDHFTYPGWIMDQGGWGNAQTINDWLDYTERIVERYRGQDVLWITFNEVFFFMLLETLNQPGPIDTTQIFTHIVQAHRAAYDLIHLRDPGARVSSTLYFFSTATQPDVDAAFIDRVADKLDFIGIDYYQNLTGPTDFFTVFAQAEPWNAPPTPKGIYDTLHYYHERFPALPLFITENGMAMDNAQPRSDGYTRSDGLRDHVYWVQRAMAEGVPVLGYIYWSLTDNYEWGDYTPRYGLYTVDVQTDPSLQRRPSDAVATYQELIQAGGVPADYGPVADAD